MAATVAARPRNNSWPLALAAVLLGVPLAASVLLERRPSLDIEAGTPTAHFYIVSVVALLALVFAVAVIWAARRLPDPRTFFLAMGFLSMATIFVAHGLGTSPLFPTHYHTAPTASDVAKQNAYLVYGAGGVTGAPVGGDDHAGHTAAASTTPAPLIPDDTTI